MLVDFLDLSSDDDDGEAVVTELNVHGKGHSFHVKAEFIDLTSDEDSFEGEHLAYGQVDSAQGTTCLKQEFVADDGQAKAAQCTVTSEMQELGASDGQGDSAQCTETLSMQEHRSDDGQSTAVQSAATLLMQERRADDGQGDAAHCTTLHMRGFAAEVGQGDAAEHIAPLRTQELRADDVQGDPAHTTLCMQDLVTDDGQGVTVQCTTVLQRQELTADDRQGDAAWFTPTSQRQEHAADYEQGDSDLCTATQQRQQLTADGQDAAAQCTTTLQRQECITDDALRDVAHCTARLQMQESDTVHGKGNAAQCTTTLQRHQFLAAGDSMQEAVQLRNSAEATMFVSGTQGTRRMTEFLNTSHASTAAPFPRQFWKAGDYELASQVSIDYGRNRLRVHPRFLHSNATSHKWSFGAIAELLDNAIDEVNNGATFVKIDKMKHSPDRDYSLVIEDNGGGMSPKSLRHCMSFGFSQKYTASSIGQYGNGFKTSTMRLGADAIVFTCTKDNRGLTRSVGLLSYTFLMRSNCDDTFVPAVDYEFDASSSTSKRMMDCGEKHFSSNLSILLRWSPFSTEDELLNQFNGMECHGTKIIVFNLWLNDALEMELDFITDKEDIMISGAPEIRAGRNTAKSLMQMHVANRFRYSLRAYASILYLHVPENFQIILCGQAVEPHYIVNDLIFRECIRYRPQVEVTTEVDVITTIGFLKGAPHLDIYGFNVYHKNRLILPYWRAGSCHRLKKGIVGVLEANFIRPTHDKQDFERTGLFHRLETRLKDMANEYWTFHCHLVGYTQVMKTSPPAYYVSTAAEKDDYNLAGEATTTTYSLHHCSNGYNTQDPLHADVGACGACPSPSIYVEATLHALRNVPQQSQPELCKQRKSGSAIFWRAQKRRNTNVYSDQPGSDNGNEMAESRAVLDQNTILKTECSELEAAGKHLTSKIDELRKKLYVWQRIYHTLEGSLQSPLQQLQH